MLTYFRTVLKSVAGLGSAEEIEPSPLQFVIIAFGIMGVFLGTVLLLLILTSLLI